MKTNQKIVWNRVSKMNPCPICKKADWCCIVETGDTALCMRVESKTPSKGNAGGWLHKVGEEVRKYIPPLPQQPQIVIDANGLWKEWGKSFSSQRMKSFASNLGVEAVALIMMGCVWAAPHNAWAFPMHDENQKIIGIRLRNESGDKWAVKGSKAGIFLPHKVAFGHRLFIVEGPTDCAAMLSMNFAAIGRPSCLGCEDLINRFIERNRIKEVVIVSDNDGPGQQGSEKLQSMLKVSSLIWTPQTKDVREFLNRGGSREFVESEIKHLIWKKTS